MEEIFEVFKDLKIKVVQLNVELTRNIEEKI